MGEYGIPIRLNIGCGENQIPEDGWKNIDARDLPGVHVVCDVLEVEDHFEHNSVDLIYACHVLEHLGRGNALNALKSWARLLKPKTGILRVCTPDIGFLARAMAVEGVHLGRLRGLIWGGQKYGRDNHKTGWDYEEMARDLRECGYYDIASYDPWDVMRPWIPPKYDDYSFICLNGIPCGLSVEAKAR